MLRKAERFLPSHMRGQRLRRMIADTDRLELAAVIAQASQQSTPPRQKTLRFCQAMRSQAAVRLHAVCMKTLKVRNIIVPIDFSKMSVEAIQIARQLARRFGASIHLAHVRQSNYAADFVAPAFMTYEQMENKPRSKSSRRWQVNATSRPRPCDVLSGAPPFDEICRLAQTIPADLVVMPTHGRTGLKHVFLGSTAKELCSIHPVQFS